MTEVDDVLVHQCNIRATILNTFRCIKDFRNDQLTTTMHPHRLEEWKELLTRLENLTTSCYVPATCSRDAIPSTSGVSRDAAAAATITTTTTMNESIDNHSDDINTSTMDEQEFGTQNTAYLEAEFVEVVPSDTILYQTLR